MRRNKPAWIFLALALGFTGSLVTPWTVQEAKAEDPPARILFKDDFENNDGAQWSTKTAGTSQILFENGRATVKGGGPENRLQSVTELIAHNLTFSFDLYVLEGNTNSALKFGFYADEASNSRYQVVYNHVRSTIALERLSSGSTTSLGSASLALAMNAGKEAHSIAISVSGTQLTVLANGSQVLSVDDAGLAQQSSGHVLFASQFPAQHYSVDNVLVTTPEPVPSGQYDVTLKVKTNGSLTESAEGPGGTLAANRASGNPGDVVTLTPTARPGYVFNGYESYVTKTGTSTDGLLTIADNRFAFNDKTGSVTIVAVFTTEPEDPNALVREYFEQPLDQSGPFTLSSPDAATITNGELVIGSASAAASVLIDPAVVKDQVNYQIQLDLRKADTKPGTLHLPFRMGQFADRYVLVLNGDRALLRRLDSGGGNEELASVAHSLDRRSQRILIDVAGATVSVSAQGKPLLSWTNPAGSPAWSGLAPAAGVIAMTPGTSFAVDNFMVRRVPVQVSATVSSVIEGKADTELSSGAVVLSRYTVAEGDTITWQAYPKGGYEFVGLSVAGQLITDGQWVVPQGTSTDLAFTAEFRRTQSTAGQKYYVDPSSGDNNNDGLSPQRAWASLAALDRVFQPGDEILLKAGSVFSGSEAALRFRGSGTEESPIRVASYGEGARPRLDAKGAVTNVVELFNQEYVHLEDLEITNLDAGFNSSFELNSSNNRQKALRAVSVAVKDFGVARGIVIRGLYIHDINGNLAMKWNGGIFFDARASVENGQLKGIPTKYDDVLVEGNTLERVDRSGIKLVGSGWCNQSLKNSPNTPLHWFPSTNVVVRGNVLLNMGGDAITVRDTDGALVEYNLVRHSRYQNTGYNAGIWPFQATNTVIQYNEVSHTHGVQDGQGLDADHVSSYSVLQYNYSHNNEGGFMLIMNGFPHTAPTIRYNISQNDADKTFEFARGTAAGTMIYNNTIYSESTLVGPRGGVLDLANSAAGTGNREIFIFNNVFHYPAGQTFYVGEAETMKTKVRLFNNAYYGGITVPAEEEQAITGDPKLPGLGTAPVNLEATKPLTGRNIAGEFAGYVPAEGSSLVGAGVTIEDVVSRYGGTVTDRRHLTAPELHELALKGNSIDFVAGRYLPAVPGVTYGRDFLGNALPDGARFSAGRSRLANTPAASPDRVTIGAIQALPQAPSTPAEDVSPEPNTSASADPVTDSAPAPAASATPASPQTPAPSSATSAVPTQDPAPTSTGAAPSEQQKGLVTADKKNSARPTQSTKRPVPVRPGLPATGI